MSFNILFSPLLLKNHRVFILISKLGCSQTSFEFLRLYNDLKIPHLHKNNKDLKAIKNFLKTQGEIENDFGSNLTGLFKIFSKITIDFAGFEGSLEKGIAQEENDLMSSLARFEEKLKRLLKYLNRLEIFLLIDKVDEVWDDTEESKLTVSGLLRATHTLNEFLPNVKTMVFLRSDMFDVLKFHDIDKFNSLSERINWSEADLKQLIENRARISTGMKSIQAQQGVWAQVFDENVKSQSSFEYIIGRTLRRPRETIQFCNKALRIAQDSKHEKILSDDILAAEIEYSTEKTRDLASEFLVQYPYLEGLFSLFQGFQASFTKEEFELRYKEAQPRLEKLYLDLQSLSSDGIAQILYNIGFLGAEIDGSSVFCYNIPNLTLPQRDKYVIHLAFHSALGIQDRIVFINTNRIQYGIGNQINVGGQINNAAVVAGVFYNDISINYGKEDLIDLLSELKTEFQHLVTSENQLNKVLVRIDAAKDEVLLQEPDKEFVATCIKRAFEVLQEEEDNSIMPIVKSSRSMQLIVRRLSKWLGVSSRYFKLDN